MCKLTLFKSGPWVPLQEKCRIILLFFQCSVGTFFESALISTRRALPNKKDRTPLGVILRKLFPSRTNHPQPTSKPWVEHGLPWAPTGWAWVTMFTYGSNSVYPLCPWTAHTCPWTTHGCPWTAHGCPWTAHGCPWTAHSCPWTAHGWTMVATWSEKKTQDNAVTMLNPWIHPGTKDLLVR